MSTYNIDLFISLLKTKSQNIKNNLTQQELFKLLNNVANSTQVKFNDQETNMLNNLISPIQTPEKKENIVAIL